MDDMAEHAAEMMDLRSTGNETLDAFYSRWEDFLILLHPRENLLSAMRAFPCVLWIVIQTSEQKRTSLPAKAARQVIDAINAGEPALPVLAIFFSTTRAVIRNSRRWPLETIQGIRSWRTACRYIHCRGVIGRLPPVFDGQWEHLQISLPLIDLLARRFKLTRRELLNSLETAHAFTPNQTTSSPPWRALRRVLQTLHALARHGTTHSSQPMHGYLQATLTRQPHTQPIPLPSGWSAMALRNWQDIAEEARQMQH